MRSMLIFHLIELHATHLLVYGDDTGNTVERKGIKRWQNIVDVFYGWPQNLKYKFLERCNNNNVCYKLQQLN